jgi:hypothetical protein
MRKEDWRYRNIEKKKAFPISRAVLLISLLVLAAGAFCGKKALAPEGDVILAQGGETRAVIVAGPEDRIAAESLQLFLETKYGVGLKIVLPSDMGRLGRKPLILVGTPETNSALARLSQTQNLAIDTLGEDGYMLKTIRQRRKRILVAAGASKRGVFYAIGELKRYHLNEESETLSVPAVDIREVPVFKYRWLWTWDWRMEWAGTEPGGETMGGGTYTKKPETFLADYKACIDFISENGLNGLIIWGFLRDAHGGIASGQELCRYAEERGVRILPGVGTSGYSGYYFEGDHDYNAATWIRRHPELESRVTYEGVPVRECPCPSKPANKKWLADGARWLFKNFAIGGVNLEMGDFFVCRCPDCQKARSAIDSAEPDYFKDMAICLGDLIPEMRRISPDAWLSYATYTGFNKQMMAHPPKFIGMIPSDAICQWTLSAMMAAEDIPDPMTGSEKWPTDLEVPTAHSIGYLHWANKSTHTENDFFLRRLQAAASNSRRAGLEGMAIYGEMPDKDWNMALNYLAFREFCFHPDMTIEDFTAKRLAPLYGADLTDTLWKIIDLAKRARAEKDWAQMREAMRLANLASESCPVDARPQWRAVVDFFRKRAH